MAQIVITAIGSTGDVHPFVAIARVLAARGHRIVFCTHAPFASLVERHGFRFVPIGTAHEYEAALAGPDLWNPRTSFKTLWGLIAPTIRPHFDTLAALATDDTVLVGSLWALSARLMQEMHGTPYVSVQVSPSTLLSAHAPPTHKRLTVPGWLPLRWRTVLMRAIEDKVLDPAVGPALNAVRDDLGLPPVRHILGTWLHSPDGVLCLFPDWFAPQQPDWPDPRFLGGFPLLDEVPDVTALADNELEAFLAAGSAPIVFTAGSTRIDTQAYARAIDEALRRTGQRAIVLGKEAVSAALPADRVLLRQFLPMRTLLPRCAAIVHHGGIGTAALAYAAGIPQVVTPFAHDQFDNAVRVARSGCGVRIDGPASGQALAAALDRLIRNPTVAARCAQAKMQMATAPDACEAAASYIERLAPPARARAEDRRQTASA